MRDKVNSVDLEQWNCHFSQCASEPLISRTHLIPSHIFNHA